MVGAIKQVEEELKRIKVAIAEIAQEFYRTYQGYLKALGQAMRQQSILASYHVCTQGYPEAFLNLSFSQRQKMQEKLREIAKVADGKLQELLQKDPEEEEKLEEGFEDQTPTTASLIMSLLSEENQDKQKVKSQLKNQEKEIEFDSSVLFTPQKPLEPAKTEEQKVEAKTEVTLNKIAAERVENQQENIIDKLDNIDKLISWQENIEKQIPELFKTLSHQINCILQKTEILPKKIPEKVLEAATKMESGDTHIGGAPNLLNLLIEAEETEKNKNSQITRVIAVNLRLSEIEFTDVNVTAWRNKIRNLLGRLSQLQREYRKKQRERAVLEAESAWRSSWYEE